jgi:hypothetical protein
MAKDRSPRADSEQLSTWISKSLGVRLRIAAAVRDMTIRQVVEAALEEWFASHPLTDDEVQQAISPDKD